MIPKGVKKIFLADFQVWIWSVILILKSVTNAPASPLPKVDFFSLKICLKSRTFRPIFLPIINGDFDPKGAIYDRAFIRFLWLIIKCDFNPKNPPILEFFSKLAYKIEHYPYFFGRQMIELFFRLFWSIINCDFDTKSCHKCSRLQADKQLWFWYIVIG